MLPEEAPLPDYSKVDLTASLTSQCYHIYLHNIRQTAIRSRSQLTTDMPGKCVPGDLVRVVTGRLVPVGTIAEVMSIYETQYGMKVKLRDSKKEYVTYVKNLEVLAVSLSRKPEEFASFKEYPEITALTKFFLEISE